MKKYTDKSENFLYKKQTILQDFLKNNLLKSLAYEKAIKSENK